MSFPVAPEQEKPDIEQVHFDHNQIYEARGPKERGAVIQILETAPVEPLGIASEVLPNVDPSNNRVEAVALNLKGAPEEVENAPLGQNKVFKISSSHEDLLAIFKPVSGENHEVKHGLGFGAFWPREVLFSRIAEEAFGLYITPPISKRTIDGELGSIQLYYPDALYRTAEDSSYPDIEKATLSKSEMQMAALDWILMSAADRHEDNYLIKRGAHADNQALPEVIAIDNAICLSVAAGNVGKFFGPSFLYTATNTRTGPVAKEELLPADLRDQLRDGLQRWDEVIGRHQGLVDLDRAHTQDFQERLKGIERDQFVANNLETELKWAKDRLAHMVETGIFLSRANCAHVPAQSTSHPPHPRLSEADPAAAHTAFFEREILGKRK